MPLGIAVIILFAIAAIYVFIKDVYINVRYHFSHTVTQILYTVLFIAGLGAFLAIASWIIDKRDKNSK
jgi:hypothetical protein